jgi:hypothetical protein
MQSKRRAHASIYNNGHVYVFGGSGQNSQLRLAERYDVVNDKWESCGMMV